MTQNNILLISGAILPVIITVIIGYISGKRKDFNWQQAGDINKIVMLYALPLSIFSNMVMTPRHIVMTMGPVAVAIILALILSFVIPLLSPAICFDATSPSVRCRRWPSARRQSRLSAPQCWPFYLAPSARR